MDFSSDTAAPVHPRILEAMVRASVDTAPSYGADDLTAQVEARLREVFETDLEVLLVSSGTAANALALACLCPPTGSILCHREAHIERDERGAPEFFTGGGKLALLPGDTGRIDMAALEAALAARDPDFVHETPAAVLSLTNLTECGTAYAAKGIKDRADLARKAGLFVHLDGARFANALVANNSSPARMSWKAGVDVLTLGATKNGAMACEAILLFGRARRLKPQLLARAKRAGHLPPKMRFLAAQMLAYLKDDLWLDLARTANDRAKALARSLTAREGARLAHAVDGNEVFIYLPDTLKDQLDQLGARYYPWPGGSYRFVCSWTTPAADIAHLDLAMKEGAT